jgi:hypothetical protein
MEHVEPEFVFGQPGLARIAQELLDLRADVHRDRLVRVVRLDEIHVGDDPGDVLDEMLEERLGLGCRQILVRTVMGAGEVRRGGLLSIHGKCPDRNTVVVLIGTRAGNPYRRRRVFAWLGAGGRSLSMAWRHPELPRAASTFERGRVQ